MAIGGFRVLRPLGIKRNAAENTGESPTCVKKAKSETTVKYKQGETNKEEKIDKEEIKRQYFEMLPNEIILKIFGYTPLNDIWKSVRMVDKRFNDICKYMLMNYLFINEKVYEEGVANCIINKYHESIKTISLQRISNANKLLEFISQCTQLQTLIIRECGGLENAFHYEPISHLKLQAVLRNCKSLSTFKFISSGLRNFNVDFIIEPLEGRFMKHLYGEGAPLVYLRDIPSLILSKLTIEGKGHFVERVKFQVENTIVTKENIKLHVKLNTSKTNMPASNFKSLPFLHGSFI